MSRGRLVVLDGPDKVGKSTQVARALAAARARGLDVVAARDPGGDPAAEALRDVVKTRSLAPWAELLTFAAARAQLVATVVRPAIEAGTHVILDRYVPSTLVYQGPTVGEDAIWALETLTGDPVADLVLVLDRSEPLGLDAGDRFEAGGRGEWEQIRARYVDRARAWGWRIVDANGTPDEVAARVQAVLMVELGLDERARR